VNRQVLLVLCCSLPSRVAGQDMRGYVLSAMVMVSGSIFMQGADRSLLTRNAKGKATTEGDPLPGPMALFIDPLCIVHWNTKRMYR